MVFTHPSGYDYQLWQQNFPGLQSTYNNLNFLTGFLPNDSATTTTTTTGNSNNLSKHSQQSHREYDPRSLLGKYEYI